MFRTAIWPEITGEKVYLRGRDSDQINGPTKGPAGAIEEALAAHPDVRECLTFGVPSADLGRGRQS